MTKKEYFQKNVPMAALYISAFAKYVFYGIEYGINDYAYITYETDNGVQVYHKLLIRYNAHYAAYVVIGGNRFYLNDFLRLQ